MKLLRRIQYLVRRRRMEAELAEELEFHRALLDNPRAMGNTTLAREDARAVWIAPWLESVWRDLVYGLRALRRQPAFTAVALLTLGSSIGLNTSLFTLFNAFALRPWDVQDAARVAAIYRVVDHGRDTTGLSLAEYRYLAAHAQSLAGVVAMRDGYRVQMEDRPAELVYTSGNYFQVLGVGMALGRGFHADEDLTSMPAPVAVLSYAAWQSRFGADPSIIGKPVRLDGVSFTVIGVASSSFTGTYTRSNEVWAPFAAQLLLRPNDPSVLPFLTSPDHCCTPVAARLAPGVSHEQARAEVELLLGRVHPETLRDTIAVTGTSFFDQPGNKRDEIVPIVSLMFSAVMLVLLLACANVGNLLLARAAARRKEMAIRLSLGGGRLRLIRQLLVESFTLALAGAALGLGLALLLPPLVLELENPGVNLNLAPDARVLGFTALLACVSCLAFGLAPALFGTRGHILSGLKGESLGSRLSLRGVLLAVQVAVSVVLLTSAGLLIGGLQRGQRIDPGFAFDGVTLISFDLPGAAYGPERTRIFARHLMDNAQAAVTNDAPLADSRTFTAVSLPGETLQRRVVFHQVSSAYFDVLRIPVVAGRNFSAADDGRHVLLVNETAVRLFFAGASPIGRSVTMDGAQEIAGVVKDARTTDLGSIEPTIYAPMPGGGVTPQVLVRGSAAAQVKRITAVARAFEPRVQVSAQPLAANFQHQFDPSRRGVVVAGTLGLLALLLAAVGMSGVFAYVVQQRTREIGVRMALGARSADVVTLVLRSSLKSVAVGSLLGIAGAGAASVLLASQFPGVTWFELPAYAAVLLLLAVAAAAASAAPVRRASRIDPVRALRWE